MAISLANFVNAAAAAPRPNSEENMHNLHSNGRPNRKVRSVDAAFLTASPAAMGAVAATAMAVP